VKALTIEYLFPAKPNVKYKDDFKQPYAYDLGKRFRRISTKAGINDLRIHDLRHFATTLLFMDGVPDAIIRRMTGHTSQIMERYKHLDSRFANQSVERIGGRISKQIATNPPTPTKKAVKNTNGLPKGRPQMLPLQQLSSGANGTLTRDLRAA
jgi:hypothetical protein